MVGQLVPFLNILTPNFAYATGGGVQFKLEQWSDENSAWQEGNLNSGNSNYSEGESVPFRLKISNADTDTNYSLRVRYDFKDGAKRGYDYLTSYDLNRSSNVPGGSPDDVESIPTDGSLGFSQIPGNFALWDGSFVGVPSGPTVSGDRKYYELTIDPSSSTVYLFWGGHLASPTNWGVGNGATSYPGSSLDMRFSRMPGDTSSQTRSINPSGIIPVLLADLSLSKTDIQDPVNAGSEVSYTITVANAGPDDAQNVVVTDNVPTEIVSLSLVSSSQGTCSDSTLPSPVVCELGTINNGDNATVSVTGTVSSSFTGDSITNTAAVFSDTLDTNTSNNSDSEPTGVVALGTIIVEKQTVPDGDQTDFTFSGTAAGAVSDGEQIVVDELAPGQYSSSEIVPDGWDLTSISCSDENSSGNLETDTATFNVEAGETVTCVFTNSRRPILTVVKSVVNDYGTAAQPDDFDLKVNDLSVDSGVSNVLNPGSYNVWEDLELGPDGYLLTSFSGNCDSEGNILLSYGDDSTCTITNTAVAPQLTVIKNVVNNDGGNAVAGNFTMNVNGTEVSNPSFPGDENGTVVTLDAGEYEVTESGPDGYSPSYSEDCNGTIGIGDVKSCTITNDDIAPTLRLVKEVIKDNGGNAFPEDWTLFAIAGEEESIIDSGDSEEFHTAIAGITYTLSESDTPSGYSASGWSCDGGSLEGDELVLGLDEDVTCTITNDDIQPLLTVTKVVNGGDLSIDDFPLFVNSTQVTSGVQNGFDAGNYTVSETSDPDYSGVISEDCSSEDGTITLNVGDEKSCTITNTRKTGTVTFDKVVVGGEESDSAWDFTIDGVEGSFKDGDQATLPTGTYTVEESGPESYFFTGVGGICSVDSEGEEGEAIVMNVTTDGGTCSFTNTLKTYDLYITKNDGVTTPVLAGGTVVYTIGYGNSGNQTVNGAVITEMVPAFTTFKASASDVGWSCPDGSSAGTICTFAVGDLDQGESGSVLFAVTVSPLITGIDGTTNVVTIAGEQDDDSSNNTADDDTPLKPGSVLAAEDEGEVLPATGSPLINLLFAALAFEVGLYLRRRSRRA